MTDKPTMTARLEAIEERLHALEDERAIRQLIAAYGPLVDSGASAAAAAIWQQDGVYDIANTGVAQGHEAIAALFDGTFHQNLIANGAAHTLGPAHIVIDGLRAVATCYSVVFAWNKVAFVPSRVAANRWELVRDVDRWRVQRRFNRLLDGAEASRVLLGAAHQMDAFEPSNAAVHITRG
jgi:hypothetical protein